MDYSESMLVVEFSIYWYFGLCRDLSLGSGCCSSRRTFNWQITLVVSEFSLVLPTVARCSLLCSFRKWAFKRSAILYKWNLSRNYGAVRWLNRLVEAHRGPVIHSWKIIENPSYDDAIFASQYNWVLNPSKREMIMEVPISDEVVILCTWIIFLLSKHVLIIDMSDQIQLTRLIFRFV